MSACACVTQQKNLTIRSELLTEPNFKVQNQVFETLECQIQLISNFKGVICNLPKHLLLYKQNFQIINFYLKNRKVTEHAHKRVLRR